jgi:hypothetical protein
VSIPPEHEQRATTPFSYIRCRTASTRRSGSESVGNVDLDAGEQPDHRDPGDTRDDGSQRLEVVPQDRLQLRRTLGQPLLDQDLEARERRLAGHRMRGQCERQPGADIVEAGDRRHRPEHGVASVAVDDASREHR